MLFVIMNQHHPCDLALYFKPTSKFVKKGAYGIYQLVYDTVYYLQNNHIGCLDVRRVVTYIV